MRKALDSPLLSVGRFLFFALPVGGLLGQAIAQPRIESLGTASAFGAYARTAAPGTYVEIYGTDLAGTTREWTGSDFQGSLAPTSLDGVGVTINGTPAYISFISPVQVNVQVPDAVPTGVPVPVVVTYRGQASSPVSLTVNPVQPGFYAPLSFKVAGIQYVAALHNVTGQYAGPGTIAGVNSSPAVPGETLLLFGIGFGPVAGSSVGGQIARGSPSLVGSIGISIGGTPAVILNAGLANGFVGLYQINLVVPPGLASGDWPVQLTLNGTAVALQNLFLAVRGSTGPSPGSSFTLTSSATTEGGALPAAYTCDGTGSTPPLAWSNVPNGTKELAVMMTTLPGDGTTKWNWVLYRVPATATSLAKDSFLVGTMGVGSDGPGTVYNPPCSQGPGLKVYTFKVYALSASPTFSVPESQVTGQMLTDAISPITLGTASLNVTVTRSGATSTNCGYISSSTRASKSGVAVVSCDGTYGYVSSLGITTDPMMNGITATNLQVPLPQNFLGANGWKIPLNPVVAPAPTSVVDGPLGVAINGVPIFNPCTQGGCVTGGDTKALGQLDSCNGHAGRADDYHYHAAPTCLMDDQPASYWDTHPLGWALDGFAIFGYRDADGSIATRDGICGGNTKPVPNAPAGYSYHVTDAPPYVTSCLMGVPSPDLAGQGAKYRPIRQPPVTPFNVSGMTLATDAEGYRVLRFTSAISFRSTSTGTDNYNNPPGTYQIRYKQVTGTDLAALLALRQNANASACWSFQFATAEGVTTQPTVSYCR